MSGIVQKYPAHNSLLPFYLAWQIEPTSSRYNMNFSYQLSDDQEVSCVVENLQKLIQLRPHLRQTFALEKDHLMAIIHEDLAAKIKYFTITTGDFSKFEQTLIEEAHDLNTQSSIFLNIIYFSDNKRPVILFNIHHIIMDGPSLDRFTMELNLLIAGEKLENQNANEYIAGITHEPLLNVDINPVLTSYVEEINSIAHEINYPIGNKNHIYFYTDVLPDAIMQKLTTLSSQYHISTFNLLLIAWSIFTAKLFNQDKALVKYAVNVRKDKLIEGCFLNTVVFLLSLAPEETYLSLIHLWPDSIDILKQMSKTMVNDKLDIGLIPSFTNASVAHDVLVIREKQYSLKNFAQIGHSNLNIRYREQGNKCYFTCDVYAELFSEHFSSSLLSRFFNYLNKLLMDSNKSLSDVDLTFSKEQQRMLYDFNKTDRPYPTNKTLTELFEEQVRKTPNAIAVVYEKTILTYAQLNQQSNQLAHYLKDHYQIQPNDLIVLLIDRNEYMLICILAILKSGGAYVPIDPSYPGERIASILSDTKAKVYLLNEAYKIKLSKLEHEFISDQKSGLKQEHVIAIDNIEMRAKLAKQLCTNPIINATSNNLAYIIYTSGTTGNPKGVMINHKSVVNTLFSLEQIYAASKLEAENVVKMTAFTSYTFDVSIAEFFSALLHGHELHILSNTLRHDTILISKYLNMHNINYIYLPPILLANLPKIQYHSLKGIIYAGESCDKETALYWSNKYKLYNYYGPTEASIYATGLQLKAGEVSLIGRPLSNVKIYVLDREKNLFPIGLIGELHIGGDCLAAGYLNQPELTNNKFIPNPFQSEAEKRTGKNIYLYKTGDFVCWLPDGNLEYIGRKDSQVKIRGHRVELGEIEAKLADYAGIDRAVVIVKKHLWNDSVNMNINHLVAYYTANKKIDNLQLYAYLEARLPEYMLPSTFIYLDKWPLMNSGKIDKSGLPNPEFAVINDYSPPSNEKEQLVCAAFSKILGWEKVGINDNFFRLGGTSIKAIALVANLQNDFKINVADVFNLKTPQKIAQHLMIEKNSLKQHLQRIKLGYKLRENNNIFDEEVQNKLEKYHAAIEELPLYYEPKSLNNILLTGATGFLGCNLLERLLASTQYTIFLLIRASSEKEAFDRINKKFKFYFNKNLDNFYQNRLFIFSADIEEKNLGLSQENYQLLVTKIDSIIHSAALTKHYGEYERFYCANIQGTINLLEFCKLTSKKDFHYISTTSVFNQGHITDSKQYTFIEDDIPSNLKEKSNFYIKSKRHGEEEVIHYRKWGVTSSIYRVGNLAFMANNYRVQENIEDNGFFNRLKSLLSLGVIAEEIIMEEISAVDLTAEAIVKLFDKKQLSNTIYHVFNPHLFNIAEGFSKNDVSPLKVVSMVSFIDILAFFLDNPRHQEKIERYLLHQGWFNEILINQPGMNILQDKTQAILQKLGFSWLPVEHTIMNHYLKKEVENVEKV